MIKFTIDNPPAGLTHKHVFADRESFLKWYTTELRPLLGGAHFDNDELTYNGGRGYLTEDDEMATPALLTDIGQSNLVGFPCIDTHASPVISESVSSNLLIPPSPKKSIGKKIAEKFTRKKTTNKK